MFVVLLIAVIFAVGLFVGWWLRGVSPVELPVDAPSEPDEALEVLSRLRELADQVASEVDQHSTDVGPSTPPGPGAAATNSGAVLQVMGRLIESNEQMQQQLQTAELKLQHQAQQIASQAVEARTDALTELANRREFDAAMHDAHRALQTRQSPATVLMIDIDHFKHLNDSYGHLAGDAVLRTIGRILLARLPRSCVIARYGGEEFAVIFPKAHAAQVERVAELARRAIGDEHVAFEGLVLRVTASCGMAELLAGETIASVISRADNALYVSKQTGRNRGHVHDGATIVPLVRKRERGALPHAELPAPPPYEAGISSPEVFSSDLQRRLSQWKQGGSPLCVLLVRIDNMEAIELRHGEANGKAAMRALILSLKAIMREIDHAARFDDQAVSLLLPGCTLRGAVATAERLRAAAARCELPARHALRRFTVSIGVAAALEDEDEDGLIQRVRQSLYVASTYGENCTYLHDGSDVHLIGAGSVSMAR